MMQFTHCYVHNELLLIVVQLKILNKLYNNNSKLLYSLLSWILELEFSPKKKYIYIYSTDYIRK